MGRLFVRTALGALLFSAVLIARGNSTGGGGGVVRDGDNPWFVQNTKIVSYCIRRDKEHFHLADSVIDQKIQAAVAYWREEFSRSSMPQVKSQRVEIATQQFQRVECDKPHDLAFQMGVLAKEQKKSCQDPKQFIGLTVRTSYDKVNLKGKGFIYVAPDSGDLKPSANELVDNPWSLHEGGLLYRVLVHELGHVFGLGHTSAPPPASGKGMMNASYAEWILQKPTADWFASHTDLPDYFAYRDRDNYWPHGVRCSRGGLNKALAVFFGIPQGWSCYSQSYHEGVLKIFASREHFGQGDSSYMGEIEFGGGESVTTEAAIDLYLPPEQKVFVNISKRIQGPGIKYVQRKGVFHSADGSVARECAVTMPLNEVVPKISGVLDGRYFMDLDAGT